MLQDDGSSSVTSLPLQFFSTMPIAPGFGSPYPYQFLKEMKSEERGLYLIHLLLTCANHVSAGNLEYANLALEQISQLASVEGDTMQRIAAYFSEALADRMLKSWPGLYVALNSTRIPSLVEEMLVRRLFFELFPFFKACFVLTNQAIIEAMEGEKMVHVIDLNAERPEQWIALIQAFGARPEGPPHLRITGIHHQREVLDHVARSLTDEAERLDLPFQFNPVVINRLENLDVEKLRVKTGEALAISSVLQLHTLLACDDEQSKKKYPVPFKITNWVQQSTLGELLAKDPVNRGSPSPTDSAASSTLTVNNSGKMEGFLHALWGLSPKIMVVTEQDASHNGPTVVQRLVDTLHYYASLFDCLESTLSRTSAERLKLEKMLFGEEIKNVISCEGANRKERHEKLERWIQRLEFAGFGSAPFSYYNVLQANILLQGCNCDSYKIKEESGCAVICWQDRPLFSVSAWRCRK
ncbi:hypothetical protein MLD38_011759 [Melastoma candidum]|uniref:Uncharacterized protein n=1 Tax=Melastoma candidum TaxID=119954 RepID=A0ACB9R7L6_9MYRT|nr:hypothetical protein MLD38_011759 [Melastoma candidum]